MRTTAVCLLLACLPALSQPATPPAFEVASIRTWQPGRESIETGPASLTMHSVTLQACIRWAYGVQDVQVVGPDWLRDTGFEIFAKSANAVSVAELRVMLQALLAERFKLAVHRDSREMTALVLTVAKGGHKLKPADAEGSPSFQSGKMNLTGKNAGVGQMVEFIANAIHTPVIDQTGLTGRYDYFLDIEMYVTEEARRASGVPPEAGSIIAAAIQAELGLKMESKKVPVDVIVVDHVEKTPTEN